MDDPLNDILSGNQKKANPFNLPPEILKMIGPDNRRMNDLLEIHNGMLNRRRALSKLIFHCIRRIGDADAVMEWVMKGRREFIAEAQIRKSDEDDGNELTPEMAYKHLDLALRGEALAIFDDIMREDAIHLRYRKKEENDG